MALPPVDTFSATATSSTTIVNDWTYSAANPNSFILSISVDGGSSWLTEYDKILGGNIRSVTWTGLQAEFTFHFRIYAVNSTGVGGVGTSEMVTTDVPVFYGCDHDGTQFIPSETYKGLLVTPERTNVLLYNYDVASHWGYWGISTDETKTVGQMTLAKCEYDSSSPTQDYIARGIQEVTVGPWCWTAFVEYGNAPGFTMEVNNDRGGATFSWAGGQLSVESTENGARAFCWNVGGSVWAACLETTVTTNQWKNAQFYPAKKGNPIDGQYTWFNPGTWIEGSEPTFDHMVTVGSSITVARTDANVDLSTLGFGVGIEGSWTMLLELSPLLLHTINSDKYFLTMSAGSSNNDAFKLYSPAGSDPAIFGMKNTINGSEKTLNRSEGTFIPGSSIKIAIRSEHVSGTLSAFFGGTKYDNSGGAGTYGSPLTHIGLGESIAMNGTQSDAFPCIFKQIELHESALSDGVIQGWL